MDGFVLWSVCSGYFADIHLAKLLPTFDLFQVLNRSMDPRTYETQAPLIQQLPQMPLLPQQMITSGTRKDCIRLRGLPYEAQVEHILEFLGEHAKSIVYQGVHMVYNAQVRPTRMHFGLWSVRS